MNVRGNSINKA